MARKEQNKILDAKIESNINQYKVDRLNAEISAFSSGDLNKYEFLTRKDLKYKPNALDKARFQFSPLGQTFSIGLDKTAQGYEEEGVMKLLKDIRDVLRGVLDHQDLMIIMIMMMIMVMIMMIIVMIEIIIIMIMMIMVMIMTIMVMIMMIIMMIIMAFSI